MARCLRRWLVATLVVVAALSAGAPLQTAAAAETLETDSVLVEVDLQSDGDAVWRVEYRYLLDDENATQAFEALRERIRENRSRYTGRFAERMRGSVAAAENDTGRPMSLADVSVTTGRQPLLRGSDSRGFVTYEFTWENFAVANSTRIRAGDAIHGFYVSPETTLVVTWPGGYESVTLAPDPDERGAGRAVWQGETAFASDEPSVVVATSGADSPRDGTADDGLPVGFLLAGLAVLGVAGAGGFVAKRRRGSESAGEGAPGADTEEAGDAGASSDAPQPADGDQSVPPELMSNEERVRAALSDHGGRMKQQELAAACDWNPSKTSKVVNELKEEGTIEVFRLGRENIVSLPEEDAHED